MNPPREFKNVSGANTISLMVILRVFMKRWGLIRKNMAEVLKTPLRTLDGWLNHGATPPACLVPLMDLLESWSQVRTWTGVHAIRHKKEPRGRPFRRGNEWRFGKKGAEARRIAGVEE